MQGLEGRRVVVTGAAGGIGEECVRAFTEAGAQVTALDHDESALDELCARLGCAGMVVDLVDTDQLGALALNCDILVNNAGIQHVSPVEDFPLDAFENMLRLMVVAPFALARAALPGMRERSWGRLVHISSVHGLRASPYKSAYVAAKHGLEGLSKVLAIEAAPYGITSNTICPGYVRTPLVSRQIAAQAVQHGIDEEDVITEILLQRSSVKRLIEPLEVAAAALYLCSPHASAITGTSLVMDGGWTAT